MKNTLILESIETLIYMIRGQKVMLDYDLAKLYKAETKYLKRQVKRNIKRFPPDFMFQLNKKETNILRCQFGTLKQGKHLKYYPFAFTEQGIAMLSSVLNNEKAIEINIAIMRVFIRLKRFLYTHKDFSQKLEKLEKKYNEHDSDIQSIFKAIKLILSIEEKPNKRIGFKI